MVNRLLMFDPPGRREVLNIRQAAEYLGITPDTLYNYAAKGAIPCFKLGNRWKFKRSKIDEWMDAQSEKSIEGNEK